MASFSFMQLGRARILPALRGEYLSVFCNSQLIVVAVVWLPVQCPHVVGVPFLFSAILQTSTLHDCKKIER